MDRRIRRRWLATGLVAVGLLAGGVIGGYVWLKSAQAEPVDVDEVIVRYRTATTTAPPAPTHRAEVTTTEALTLPVATTAQPTVAPAGVYVYDTVGSEGVDALGGSDHEYPSATTVTMTDLGDGCLHTRWDALEQRWEDAHLCRRPDGWHLVAKTVFHSFFHQSDERAFSCMEGSMYLPTVVTPGATFSAVCTSTGTSESGASTELINGRVIGTEALQVAGQPVETVHVRYEIIIGGQSTGRTDIDRWYALDPSPLVVREVRQSFTDSETPIGTVHYEEHYELIVQSVEPIA